MWICCQIGAREHYAVPRALHEQGLLAGLVTDWYAFTKKNTEKLKTETLKSESKSVFGVRNGLDHLVQRQFQHFSISAFQRFGGASARAARCEAIPDELVHAFPLRSLLWKWRVRRLAAQGRSYEAYCQTDAAFARAVARLQLPPHEVLFGYSYASLEILEMEKKRGVLTVLDQIDPGAVEFRRVAEEMKQHPEIAGPAPDFPIAYYERNRREWELADIIIVNSEWSRQALISEGADPAKIDILPLAYGAEDGGRTTEDRGQKTEVRTPASAPLRVLWLGQVNVRKGIHYLMAAGRLLEDENIQFEVVGPVGILPEAVAAAPRNMTFHGPVSRDRAADWYRQSDVFVLPTLSDGFALTQLEALAHGLPVITTPNCGRVIEEGKTGFIVPPRDPQALANAVLKFVADRNLSTRMSPDCREAITRFSINRYGQNMVRMINVFRPK